MTKELTKTQEEILRLHTGNEDLKNTEITKQVGCSESTTSTTIKKFERNVLPHPDAPPTIETQLDTESARFVAEVCIQEGGKGLEVARDILNQIPDKNMGGGTNPNL